MSHKILNVNSILDLPEEYVESEDYTFIPIPLLIYLLEYDKKNTNVSISSLIAKLECSVDHIIFSINLSPLAISRALEQEDFKNRYLNSKGNPFKFASEVTLYDSTNWGDFNELMESFKSISLW